MAGRKGKSGPPKNTNAAKYGWRTLWRGARLREADAWVKRPVGMYIQSLAADKPNITAVVVHDLSRLSRDSVENWTPTPKRNGGSCVTSLSGLRLRPHISASSTRNYGIESRNNSSPSIKPAQTSAPRCMRMHELGAAPSTY